MEKRVFGTLIIVLLVGLVAGYYVAQPQISRLQEQVAALQNQVNTLQNQINEKNAQISTLQSRISGLEQQLEIKILGVYFSPRGGCEDQVIYWINRANVSIHVLIYSFTLDSVGDALINAHGRGVEVKVVFEKGQISQYSEYQRLKAAGVGVRNDTNSNLMHNKVMIVDGTMVLTGSFNWSASAEEYNNENLIIIKSTYIAIVYNQEFEKIWNESV